MLPVWTSDEPHKHHTAFHPHRSLLLACILKKYKKNLSLHFLLPILTPSTLGVLSHREPLTLVDPLALSPTAPARSIEHERDPLASARDPWRWCGGVAGGEWAALPHPSARTLPTPTAPSLTPATELPPPGGHGAPRLPSPTVATEPSPVLVTVVLARSRSPPAPTVSPGIDRSRPLSLSPPMLQMYVSIVSEVLEVYCNCFIWMLQK